MGIRDAIKYLVYGPQPAPPPARAPLPAPDPRPAARAIAGGRLSVDKDGLSGLGASWLTVLPPDSWERHWRTHALDARSLEQYPPAELLHILTNLSPDVSRALWDFLRLCNPGWEAKALRPGSEEEDARGQAIVDGVIARLTALYGTPDVLWSRLFINIFLRGAILCEGVFDKAGRELVDVAVPDAASARFRRLDDPVRGRVWQLGQQQAQNFVPLDRETIVYVPVDPLPDSPYGRPLASPALFVVVFAMGMLSDLRRVIQQQGWPRLDLSVNLEMLAKGYPAIAANPKEWPGFVNGIITEVQGVFAGLQPDDSYVHTDLISVNRPVGAIDTSSLGAIDGLMEALDRMMVRALKTMPLMMGITDGVSEANANRQYEIFAAGIKATQHFVETSVERLLALACQAQGVLVDIDFKFAELRAAELLRDAQTEALLIANAAAKRDQGWWTQDEASNAIVGADAAKPGPINQAAPNSDAADDAADVVAEPGSNRAAPTNGHAHRDPALASLAAIYGMNGRDA